MAHIRTPSHAANQRSTGWLVAAVVVVLALLLGVVSWAVFGSERGGAPRGNALPGAVTSTPSADPSGAPTPSPTPSPTPPPDIVLSLVAGGDVLLHSPVHASARTADGDYDFEPLLAGLDEWIQGADLALCHLEVPFTQPGQAVSGFPTFAASPNIAQNLLDQGWDGCSVASNHTVDKGWGGLVRTLDVMDDVGLGHHGSARTEAESDAPALYTFTREGREITIANLSYTYGLNGLPMPSGRPWAVELLDAERAVEQAAAAREAGADIVIVSMHAGTEYVFEPVAQQRNFATALAESGEVDLVIGHHPHVPQPFELLDGGVSGDGMWVAWSLGNYLSNQSTECCRKETNSGLIMLAELVIPHEGPVRIENVGWKAVTVDRAAGHKMHVLHPDVEAGTLSAGEVQDRYDRTLAILGDSAPEWDEPPVPSGPPPTFFRSDDVEPE